MSLPDIAEPPAEGWQVDTERVQELEEYFHASLGFQSWRLRFLNWVRRMYGGTALVLAVICIVQTVTIAHLVPAQRIETQLMFMQWDGTFDSVKRIQDLPPNKEVAGVKAALWLYIKNRESYTWDDAPDRYDFVNAMSSRTVREDYDKWMRPENPESPQRLMHDGHISVEKISGPTITSPEIVPTPAVVRFRRTIDKKGELTKCATWTADLDFMLTNRMSEKTRDNGDPGGIVITNYQAQQDSVDDGVCKQ